MSQPPGIGINIPHSQQPSGFQYPQYPPQQQQPYPQPYSSQSNYPPSQQQQPFPTPIQTQPGAQYETGAVSQWYQNTNFADYLRNAHSFHVKQSVELLEAFVGWESPNKYSIKDQNGNKIFAAVEDSDTMCTRQLCGKHRAFTIRLRNMTKQDVLLFERGFDCSCCFALCCPDSLKVMTSTGQLLGTVTEEFHIFSPTFTIRNAVGNPIFKVDGPMCVFSACPGQNVLFKLCNASNGAPVGTISKEWSGWGRELFTDADYFSMSFPVDLDPSLKAVCLGALFLIDYQFFERSGDLSGR